MDYRTMIEEMTDLVLNVREPSELPLFVDAHLELRLVRLGCMRILEWLRSQAIRLEIRPVRLRPGSEIDQACVRLLRDGPEWMASIFHAQTDVLSFAGDLPSEDARELMRRAQEVYRPPIVL